MCGESDSVGGGVQNKGREFCNFFSLNPVSAFHAVSVKPINYYY